MTTTGAPPSMWNTSSDVRFPAGERQAGEKAHWAPSAGLCRRLFSPVPGHGRAPLRPARNAPSLRALVFAMRMRGRFRRRLSRAAGLEKAGQRFRPSSHEGALCRVCRLLFRRLFRLVRQGGTGPALCFVRRVSVRVSGRGRASFFFSALPRCCSAFPVPGTRSVCFSSRFLNKNEILFQLT